MSKNCLLCERPARSRGWCHMHYMRWVRHGDPLYEMTHVERFWQSVQQSEACWLWTGAKAGGYGQCRRAENDKTPAHRFSWELHHGPIPDGQQVLHRCDVKLCVRPDHLFLGDSSDNMQDMVSKGFHPKQVSSYRAKLVPDQVREIRASNEPRMHIARRFGVSDSLILKIQKRQVWKNL